MSTKVTPPLPPTYRQGLALMESGQNAQARALFQQLTVQKPDFVDGWVALGVSLRKLERFEEAVAVYEQAVARDPDCAVAWSNMGNALKDAFLVDESINAHAKAVALAPDNAGFIYNYGIALAYAHRLEEAMVQYDRALQLRPGDTDMLWDRARVLLHLGDFVSGWPAYRVRWKLPSNQPRYTGREWDGQGFAGKRLLLHCEQGFGDTIQCLRFIPQAKALGGTVIVECQPPLIPLVRGIQGVDEIVAKGAFVPEFDLQASLLELPRLFQPTLAAIPPCPYLHTPPQRRGTKHGLFRGAEGKLKVGIVWSGSVTFKGNRSRATSLDRFLAAFAMPGVQLYSLQKGEPEAELKELGSSAPIIDLAPHLDDFADTAAILDELDLVIMTDSSVAHLCGAMNKPVWVLLGFGAHWLWLRQNDCPWYPSMRFFRQAKAGDWEPVFTEAAQALRALAGNRQAAE